MLTYTMLSEFRIIANYEYQ